MICFGVIAVAHGWNMWRVFRRETLFLAFDLLLLKSLIIHKEKTKESITVKEEDGEQGYANPPIRHNLMTESVDPL